MGQKYVTEAGVKYRIRGPYSAAELRELYKKTLEKYPGTTLTFRGYLVWYGKVHSSVRRRA